MLAFTGFHFGDPPLVEDDAAHKLHPEGPLPQYAHGCLPHGGEGLRQDAVQGFAGGKAALEFSGFRCKLGIGHGLVFRLHGFDLVYDGVYLLQWIAPRLKVLVKMRENQPPALERLRKDVSHPLHIGNFCGILITCIVV